VEKLNRLVTFFRARYLSLRHGDGEGATVVEYSLLAALIAAICIITVTTIGRQIA
jgi:hypothetical protein